MNLRHSAVENGARILESHGVCGSFYAAGGLCATIAESIPMFERPDRVKLVAAATKSVAIQEFRG